jgi:acetyl-CoA/propionyl-CoA carboxylase carboxyl transferase subunit
MTIAADRPAELAVSTDLSTDPRAAVNRLTALLDPGTLRDLTPRDDSGVLAVAGHIDGSPVVAFATDAPTQGGAMGSAGCTAVVTAYDEAVPGSAKASSRWTRSVESSPR